MIVVILFVYTLCLYWFFHVASCTGSMKHRSVKHFGYEFLYGSNSIDKNKPLKEKIPSICDDLINRMKRQSIIDFIPDQLTINQYEPGQGEMGKSCLQMLYSPANTYLFKVVILTCSKSVIVHLESDPSFYQESEEKHAKCFQLLIKYEVPIKLSDSS